MDQQVSMADQDAVEKVKTHLLVIARLVWLSLISAKR